MLIATSLFQTFRKKESQNIHTIFFLGPICCWYDAVAEWVSPSSPPVCFLIQHLSIECLLYSNPATCWEHRGEPQAQALLLQPLYSTGSARPCLTWPHLLRLLASPVIYLEYSRGQMKSILQNHLWRPRISGLAE